MFHFSLKHYFFLRLIDVNLPFHNFHKFSSIQTKVKHPWISGFMLRVFFFSFAGSYVTQINQSRVRIRINQIRIKGFFKKLKFYLNGTLLSHSVPTAELLRFSGSISRILLNIFRVSVCHLDWRGYCDSEAGWFEKFKDIYWTRNTSK